MQKIVLLFAIAFFTPCIRAGGHSGEEEEEERGRRRGPPESPDEVFLGFEPFPAGCQQELQDAFECKMQFFEANWDIGRTILENKKRCYEEAGCEVNEDNIDKIKEYLKKDDEKYDEDDPEDEADEEFDVIKKCLKEVVREQVGTCFSGNSSYAFPLIPAKPREELMPFQVLRGEGKTARRRRKRSPGKRGGSNPFEQMMHAAQQMMNASGEEGDRMAMMMHMMQGEKKKRHMSLFDRAFECSEEDEDVQRRQAGVCFEDWLDQEEPWVNRVDNMKEAVQCLRPFAFSIDPLPLVTEISKECRRHLVFRGKHVCKCAQTIRDDLNVAIASAACLPKRYYMHKYEIVKKMARGAEYMLCKKNKHDDGDFNLDKFFDHQQHAQEKLMNAVLEGEVEMDELMEKSMHMAMKMMKKFGGGMKEKMEEMMEDGRGNDMMKMIRMKMAMKQKMMMGMSNMNYGGKGPGGYGGKHGGYGGKHGGGHGGPGGYGGKHGGYGHPPPPPPPGCGPPPPPPPPRRRHYGNDDHDDYVDDEDKEGRGYWNRYDDNDDEDEDEEELQEAEEEAYKNGYQVGRAFGEGYARAVHEGGKQGRCPNPEMPPHGGARPPVDSIPMPFPPGIQLPSGPHKYPGKYPPKMPGEYPKYPKMPGEYPKYPKMPGEYPKYPKYPKMPGEYPKYPKMPRGYPKMPSGPLIDPWVPTPPDTTTRTIESTTPPRTTALMPTQATGNDNNAGQFPFGVPKPPIKISRRRPGGERSAAEEMRRRMRERMQQRG